ncbi:hypothetical protein EIP91_001082 [Steccherinum ochraceum]|uniref:Protein kinase domain-containing protein n=1 Tax=Steccherinum ochraceum TaxID=92696 RepID=A0A4R0RVB3_9APHY|nr:hypothetical protein EIP91_001082 [Steccherinum ochraceum]
MSKQRADYLRERSAGTSAGYTGVAALLPGEVLWRERYTYLEAHGYVLRQRYRPDWVPSWLNTGFAPYSCEDSIMSLEDQILDAVRLRDNLTVAIKIVSSASEEITIARLLSSAESSRNPNNHCVPIEDVIPDPLNPNKSLLIMPYLRPFDSPPFEVVEEVMDFIKQTLEGLCFIHSQGIAHRDCTSGNIMMDGRSLFPDGHHPVYKRATQDISGEARHFNRVGRSIRYYYIDFGMSSHFKGDESPYVLGAKGGDQDVPELSNEYPYNAFMVDIFILGHLYEMEFLQVYLGLSFLEPLVSALTHSQPERRPTAESALRMFHDIHQGLNHTHLHWRLRKRSESGTERVVYDTISAAKMGLSLVRRGIMGS